ncbi:hypothetical protein ACXR2T_09775 [Leucobacter sp. HY1910]
MSKPEEYAVPSPYVHELFGLVDYDIDAAINDMIDREDDCDEESEGKE